MRNSISNSSSSRRRWAKPFVGAAALWWLLAGAAAAQDFGFWTKFNGDGTSDANNGVLSVLNSPALNPTTAITVEAWVSLETPFATGQHCRSLVGKNYTTSYWLGVCGSTVRFYSRGGSSFKDAGTVPNGQWTHIAVTSDGSTQSHYINGELIQSFPVTGPPTASTNPLEIGGDFSWVYSPKGGMTEVRLWNVARTVQQIRSTINVQLTSPQAGLVAVWSMGGANDALGGHNGTFAGTVFGASEPVIFSCGSSGTNSFCLDSRFSATVSWRIGPPSSATTGIGTTVASPNPDSGVFWFFAVNDWELMVKVIDGCALNSRFWVFSAATTDVFYRLEVNDVRAGTTKVYFNYPGPPAPAVTDVSAFATCP
ncbi:MAG TPA: LamG domain-containing protein [Thermoanaerobaculia bacterium]|nr:LamG domain-containing protein [Thermoanaerobaculia bacterium]